jgi:alpha-D-xyloside xylohydrolase
MKFTDGYWEMRPGVKPYYADHPHEVETGNGSITVYAATNKLSGRGDTLNLPLITIQFSAPMDDIIRVRAYHHKGQSNPGPEFHLNESPSSAIVSDEEQVATLTSGRLKLCVHKGEDWRVAYLAGDRVLTSSSWRSLGFVDTPEGRFIHEQLNLGVGEYVYGLGERFTHFVKTVRSSICGTRTAAQAANWPTRISPFT